MSAHAWSMLRDTANQLHLSSVSIAEMAIKIAAGKLTLGAPFGDFVKIGVRSAGIISVPLSAAGAMRLADLPTHHRDPFDRLLIATDLEEGLFLLTNDSEIHKYPVRVVW
jgi:PIN domain nuclease of toxin-antitoxin system